MNRDKLEKLVEEKNSFELVHEMYQFLWEKIGGDTMPPFQSDDIKLMKELREEDIKTYDSIIGHLLECVNYRGYEIR